MSTTSLPLPAGRAPAARADPLARRSAPELAALLVLAGVLYLWALDRNGFANEYYSAAVRSMSTSWHAFLYGSFDAAGVMTVDKPPLALWVQALSARVFGFSSWSLLVPQALMGVATVGLVYDLTRRRFGRAARASPPAWRSCSRRSTVAIARHNNPDALLVLCCTAALWCVVRGLEDGRTRWLVLAGVAVGLGFEAKMAAALLVVPGDRRRLAVGRPARARRRGRAAAGRRRGDDGGRPRLADADLAHARRRPAVGVRHQRQQRLVADPRLQRPRPPVRPGRRTRAAAAARAAVAAAAVFGGEPGVLRLLNESLGGQAGWLLGVALVGGIAVLAVTRLRRARPPHGLAARRRRRVRRRPPSRSAAPRASSTPTTCPSSRR